MHRCGLALQMFKLCISFLMRNTWRIQVATGFGFLSATCTLATCGSTVQRHLCCLSFCYVETFGTFSTDDLRHYFWPLLPLSFSVGCIPAYNVTVHLIWIVIAKPSIAMVTNSRSPIVFHGVFLAELASRSQLKHYVSPGLV